MFERDYKVIETIVIGPAFGGTYLQLVAERTSQKEYIRLWSSLSKQWKIMYRYNVTESWRKWKRTEKSCQHIH